MTTPPLIQTSWRTEILIKCQLEQNRIFIRSCSGNKTNGLRLWFFLLYVCVRAVVSDSLRLMTVAHQAPPSTRFSRQEHWSRQPCPPWGDLPDVGIEPVGLTSPTLAGGFFTTSTTWVAQHYKSPNNRRTVMLMRQSPTGRELLSIHRGPGIKVHVWPHGSSYLILWWIQGATKKENRLLVVMEPRWVRGAPASPNHPRQRVKGRTFYLPPSWTWVPTPIPTGRKQLQAWLHAVWHEGNGMEKRSAGTKSGPRDSDSRAEVCRIPWARGWAETQSRTASAPLPPYSTF